MSERVITAIDLGSHKIRTVIALVSGEKKISANVIGVGVTPSAGIRRGTVVDTDETIRAITRSLEDAERMAGESVRSAVVAIGGSHTHTHPGTGTIAITATGNEIGVDDTERTLEAARALALPQNEQILKIVPQTFSVDNEKGITDPVGMTGIRLEVAAHLITGTTTVLRNFEKCVHEAGVDVLDFVPYPLAAAAAVLTRSQRELGTVVVDIGAGGTSLAVFEENVLLHTATIPVGGALITGDCAIGLRTDVETAEAVKVAHGTLEKKVGGRRDEIDLGKFSKTDTHRVSRHDLTNIVEARYEEIFHFVREELRTIGRDSLLPGGVVLTGGAAKIPGILELARDTMGLPTSLGHPRNVEGVVDQIEDPSFAVVLGSILLHARENGRGGSFRLPKIGFGKSLSKARGWFQHLLP